MEKILKVVLVLFALILFVELIPVRSSASMNPRELPPYTPVELSGYVVTVANNGIYYAQLPDRANGIRIRPDNYQSFNEGDCISASGYIDLDPVTGETEFVIPANTTALIQSGFAISRPLGMNQAAIFKGLSPQGSYIKIWGKVTYSDSSAFYIDDGSGMENDLDDSTKKGIKIVQPYANRVVGSQSSLSGATSFAKTTSGTVLPCFIPSNSQISEIRGKTSYALTGGITADVQAAGKTVTISTDCGSTTCLLNSNGIGNYVLPLATGKYAVSARLKGYKTQTKNVVLSLASTLNFTLAQYDTPVVIDIVSDYNALPNDGITTTVVSVIVRTPEGQPYENKVVTVQLSKGTFTSPAQATTNSDGRAFFTIRSSIQAEGAIFTATCGSNVSNYWLCYVDFANEGPVCWPDEIMKNKVVSGDVLIKTYATDYSQYDPAAETWIEAECMNIMGYVMKIDGQVFCSGTPMQDDLYPDNYPALKGKLETENYSNGPHTITLEVTDTQGNLYTAAIYSLIFDNSLSEVTVAGNGAMAGEVDLATNEKFNIGAKFKQTTHWRVCGYDFDRQSPNGMTNEIVIAEGTGTQISCQFDGRLPGYASDATRSDLIYVSIQTETPALNALATKSASAGLSTTSTTSWTTGKKRQVGIKPFPDSQIDILLVQGSPMTEDAANWTKDYVGIFPFRSECLFKRATKISAKARRIGFTVATWPRIKSILLNGRCRYWYYCGHALYQGFGGTYTTQIILNNSTIFSKRIDLGNGPIGAGNLEELGMKNNPKLIFAMFDGCNTGQGGGTGLTGPIVPANRKNDVAEALGMYSPSATGRVYLGWRGKISANNTTSNFVGCWDRTSNSTKGVGMFDLWTRSSGKTLGSVIGSYPPGSPYILSSQNSPESDWPSIYSNLRIYGSTEGWANNGQSINDRMFTLIP